MRLLYLCLPALVFGSSQLAAAPLAVTVNAESAILMNADTGAILYEKNAKTPQYPASITKIATALYALKHKSDALHEVVTAEQESIVSIGEDAKRRANYSLPAYWLVPGSTHIGIKRGEQIAFKDLLYGMMVASGNDASNVIAQHVGEDIPAFMAGVNAYLKEIGCENTTFYNPHGLHHPKHMTTAYDMAVMTREAVKNPVFCEIVSTVRYTRPKTNKQESTTLVQTNRLLRSGKLNYPAAFGVKTGYTSSAQNTFVAAAKKDDRVLIAVLLKSKEREDIFRDAAKLFEAAFNQPKVERVLVKAGQQKYTLELEGAEAPVTTYVATDHSIVYYPAEEPKLKALLVWEQPLELPIAKGQRVGVLRLQDGHGNVLTTVPLLAQEDVSSSWLHSIQHAFSPVKNSLFWKIVFIAILVAASLWVVSRLRR